MNKKQLIKEGMIQKAVDWFAEKMTKHKVLAMAKEPSSEWNKMKNSVAQIRNNQVAIKNYMDKKKYYIDAFAESLKDPRTLRMIFTPEETDKNIKRGEYLLNMCDKTGDLRYSEEANKYLPYSDKYLDYEKSPKYEEYMNKFFQTHDTKYFLAALKYNPTQT